MAVASNKLWAASSRTRSVAGPKGEPIIGYWPRGPAKVSRPRNVAAVNWIFVWLIGSTVSYKKCIIITHM